MGPGWDRREDWGDSGAGGTVRMTQDARSVGQIIRGVPRGGSGRRSMCRTPLGRSPLDNTHRRIYGRKPPGDRSAHTSAVTSCGNSHLDPIHEVSAIPAHVAQCRTCGVRRARSASLVATGPDGGTWARVCGAPPPTLPPTYPHLWNPSPRKHLGAIKNHSQKNANFPIPLRLTPRSFPARCSCWPSSRLVNPRVLCKPYVSVSYKSS